MPLISNVRPHLREYIDALDRVQVIALWRTVFGYEIAHNEPALAIRKKTDVNDHMFFVAEDNSTIVGTAMAGYDGHRGWLYAAAVHPNHRRVALGSRLVRHAEQALAAAGCMKVNLLLLGSNEATASFYRSMGYTVEPRISMGKVLHENVCPQRVA